MNAILLILRALWLTLLIVASGMLAIALDRPSLFFCPKDEEDTT